jgi:hypothetical protein
MSATNTIAKTAINGVMRTSALLPASAGAADRTFAGSGRATMNGPGARLASAEQPLQPLQRLGQRFVEGVEVLVLGSGAAHGALVGDVHDHIIGAHQSIHDVAEAAAVPFTQCQRVTSDRWVRSPV